MLSINRYLGCFYLLDFVNNILWMLLYKSEQSISIVSTRLLTYIYRFNRLCMCACLVVSNSATPWAVACRSHQGSPRTLKRAAYPFSWGPAWPRNWTGVPCIAGGFFTSWATREAQQFVTLSRSLKRHSQEKYLKTVSLLHSIFSTWLTSLG